MTAVIAVAAGVAGVVCLSPRTAAAAEDKDAACLECHGEHAIERAADGSSVFVDGAAMAAALHGKARINCVDCHVDLADAKPPTAAAPHAKKLAAVECAGCHELADMGPKHKFHPQLVDKPDQVSCQQCHGNHDVRATKDPAFKFNGAGQAAACGACHEVMRDDFAQSEHARAQKDGLAEAPTCIECHQVALVTPPKGASAVTLRQNQARLCLSCHLDNAAVRARIAPSAGFIASYEKRPRPRAGGRQRQGPDLQQLSRQPRRQERARFDSVGQPRHRRGGLRRVPRRGGQAVERQHPRHRARQGEQRRPHLHHLPRRARHPRARRSARGDRSGQPVPEGLRPLPRIVAAVGQVRHQERSLRDLLRQLPRPRHARGKRRGRQLRELPRRARHPPVDGSEVAYQQEQPGRDLRQMPQGRQRQVHRRHGPPQPAAVGGAGAVLALDAVPDLHRDRAVRHGQPQRPRLHQAVAAPPRHPAR